MNRIPITLCLWLFLFVYSVHAQGDLWHHLFTNDGDEKVVAQRMDGQGNTYLTGTFNGKTLGFQTGNVLYNAGGEDIFLAKFDGSGKLSWAKAIGGKNTDIPTDIYLNEDGMVYLCGSFESASITIGSQAINNTGAGRKAFMCCLDGKGTLLWSKGIEGDRGHDIPMFFAGAGGSNIYLAGTFASATLIFGSDTLRKTTAIGDQEISDVFVLKFTREGQPLWAIKVGGPVNYTGLSFFRTDPSGNIYLSGLFDKPVMKIGGNTLFVNGGSSCSTTSNGTCNDVFLVKCDSSGTLNWSGYFKGADNEISRGFVADEAGNSYTLVDFASDILTIGKDTVYRNKNFLHALLLCKFDESGKLVWHKMVEGNILGPEVSVTPPISIDQEANLYLTSDFMDIAIFASDTLNVAKLTDCPNSDCIDMVFLSLDSSGNKRFIHNLDPHTTNSVAAHIINPQTGANYIVGYFRNDSLMVGATAIVSDNFALTYFVLETNSQGNVIGAKKLFSGGVDRLFLSYNQEQEVVISGQLGTSQIVFENETLSKSGNIVYYDLLLVKESINNITGLWEKPTGEVHTVFPNPSQDQFQVSGYDANKNGNLEIVNSMGQVMTAYSTILLDGKLLINHRLTPGLYCVSFTDQLKTYAYKVFIK